MVVFGSFYANFSCFSDPTVFEKIERQNGCFFVIFGLTLAMFLTSQSYNFDAIVQARATLSVE